MLYLINGRETVLVLFGWTLDCTKISVLIMLKWSVMHLVSCRADLFSESQRIAFTIESRTKDIPDARTYLLTLKEIRIK